MQAIKVAILQKEIRQPNAGYVFFYLQYCLIPSYRHRVEEHVPCLWKRAYMPYAASVLWHQLISQVFIIRHLFFPNQETNIYIFVPFLEVFVNKICIIVNRSQITVRHPHSHSVQILQTLALDVELYCSFAPRTEIIYVLMYKLPIFNI